MAIKESSYCNNSEKSIKRVCAIRYYSHCGEKGYNSRICIIEIKDVDNSNTFKE